MIRYDLYKDTIEIPFKKRGSIHPGCVFDQDDRSPELIDSFSEKEDALKALKKYKSEIIGYSNSSRYYYSVTEYYVGEYEYEADNIVLKNVISADVWEISEMDRGDYIS